VGTAKEETYMRHISSFAGKVALAAFVGFLLLDVFNDILKVPVVILVPRPPK
jgi:hypothetical protein